MLAMAKLYFNMVKSAISKGNKRDYGIKAAPGIFLEEVRTVIDSIKVDGPKIPFQ